MDNINIYEELAKNAAFFLFPEEVISDKLIDNLQDYITKRYTELNCCVLYALSPNFVGFMVKNKIDPDIINRKEVRINENKNIFLFPDYRYPHTQKCRSKANRPVSGKKKFTLKHD